MLALEIEINLVLTLEMVLHLSDFRPWLLLIFATSMMLFYEIMHIMCCMISFRSWYLDQVRQELNLDPSRTKS